MKRKPIDGCKSLELLIKDLNVEGKEIWALKKIKTVDPIVMNCVRELSKIEPLKFIKITVDGILASNITEGDMGRKPIAEPFHSAAIGVHLIYDFQYKTMEFYEINSAAKGWGDKIVGAALRTLPYDWHPTIVMDYSDGFWEKMRSKYNSFDWLEI